MTAKSTQERSAKAAARPGNMTMTKNQRDQRRAIWKGAALTITMVIGFCLLNGLAGSITS